MSYQSRIEKSIFRKKANSSFNVYCDIVFILAKEFGWTPQEINDIPIPIVNALSERITNYYKEQNKANKKR